MDMAEFPSDTQQCSFHMSVGMQPAVLAFSALKETQIFNKFGQLEWILANSVMNDDGESPLFSCSVFLLLMNGMMNDE